MTEVFTIRKYLLHTSGITKLGAMKLDGWRPTYGKRRNLRGRIVVSDLVAEDADGRNKYDKQLIKFDKSSWNSFTDTKLNNLCLSFHV